MLFQVKLVERPSADPQEERAMIKIRLASLNWLQQHLPNQEVQYCFRDEENRTTYLYVDFDTNILLHQFVDSDPLVSYSIVEIEPLLSTVEMVEALSTYLKLEQGYFSEREIEELEFPVREIDPSGSYYLARKTVAPFSSLLSLELQDKVHHNTIISQRAHYDEREIADYNPVGKPVGILIMKASSEEERFIQRKGYFQSLHSE